MSRFDRRLKGATNTKPGSGASCVPQPIPRRGPLLSGMMFGGSRQRITPSIQSNTVNSTIVQSLDSIVNDVNKNNNTENPSKTKMKDTNMRRRRRLDSSNVKSSSTNKVYESLDKRLSSLEKMYSENMENMEKYVRNQEDRINLLTADYRKTLETLNKIIKDMNTKILELDSTTLKKPKSEEFGEEVIPEKATIVSVKKPNVGDIEEVKLPKAKIVGVKKGASQEKNDDKVIKEVTEEMLSKVSEVTSKGKKNISFTVTEKEEVST